VEFDPDWTALRGQTEELQQLELREECSYMEKEVVKLIVERKLEPDLQVDDRNNYLNELSM
jgi:hypothetical protein